MAASDHLSEQFHPAFEVLHQNRAIRMGTRTYPAVWTGSYEHPKGEGGKGGYAIVPMESGNLAHVEHTSEPFNEYPAGYRTVATVGHGGGESIHHTTDPTELHRHLDELSRLEISPVQREENRETIRQHLEWNKQGLGLERVY